MILERLRTETAENHRKLEETGFLSPVSSPDISLPHYISILKKFYGYFNPLESAISQIEPINKYLPDFSERRKSTALLTDLKNCKEPVSGIITCQDIPDIANMDAAFGALYVMEGSTLGGSIIYKNINKTLNLDNMSGCSFFYGYGPQTGSKWKAFREALTEYAEKEGDQEQIIKSADETFGKLIKWIEG